MRRSLLQDPPTETTCRLHLPLWWVSPTVIFCIWLQCYLPEILVALSRDVELLFVRCLFAWSPFFKLYRDAPLFVVLPRWQPPSFLTHIPALFTWPCKFGVQLLCAPASTHLSSFSLFTLVQNEFRHENSCTSN